MIEEAGNGGWDAVRGEVQFLMFETGTGTAIWPLFAESGGAR